VYASCVLALLALPAKAQEWSAEQLEVWELVSRVWDLKMAGDDAWMDLLHDSFQSWPHAELMPHDKAEPFWISELSPESRRCYPKSGLSTA
jgi:hypothetical protein